MKKRTIKAITMALAIAAALTMVLYAGCEGGYFAFFNIEDVTFEAEPSPGETTYTPVPVIPGGVANKLFGLAYLKNETFNPITGENSVNKMAGGLVYEGLFALSARWEAEEVLAAGYEITDELHWVFRIRQGVAMHDGKELTAADCEYSINLARTEGQYKSRLSAVTSVRATGDYEITLTLSRPVSRLCALLDLPIIRSGDTSPFPAGTGPYRPYAGEDETVRLAVFAEWWKKGKTPVNSIELISAENIDELVTHFDSGAVDVIQGDPTGTEIIGLRGGYEIWEYETLTMQYIGFNTKRAPFSNLNVRRAMSRGFDREYLAGTVFAGYVSPASLPAPASSAFYDETVAGETAYSLVAMSEILHDEGFEDGDNDGVLEYPVGNRREPMALDFIVNVENTHKVRAAEAIAAALGEVGIDLTVRALKWSEYNAALESGDYDMYYAEVRLSADLSPRTLVSYGGNANPAGYSNAELDALVYAFEANATKQTAAAMYRKIADEAPFAPILFKKEYAYTPRGVVRGISPTQANIFYAIERWTISK